MNHINIYSKGETKLGRWMSNFTRQAFCVDGVTFQSIEGYWYYIQIDAPHNARKCLITSAGFEAKKLGQYLRKKHGQVYLPDFEERIKEVLRLKLDSNSEMKKALKESCLPFEHYYVFGGAKKDAGFKWIVEEWELIRKELSQEETKMRLTTCQLGSARADHLLDEGWNVLDITIKSGVTMFAPTWAMVKDYKKGLITTSEYTKKYHSMMRDSYSKNSDAWKALLFAAKEKPLALACYCKPEDFCHRQLLLGFLVKLAKSMDLKGSITPEKKFSQNACQRCGGNVTGRPPKEGGGVHTQVCLACGFERFG